ncbi:MAG: excinuclease ABC subunit UvrC [bacterium]
MRGSALGRERKLLMISEDRATDREKAGKEEKAGKAESLKNSKTPEQSLDEVVRNLPENPGVYLMKDAEGRILYIGKAISLRKRVSSYFRKTAAQDPKVESLVPQIRTIDYIVTSSELEALILENNLIKKHKPKYNIILKDDKNYPYLCLTVTEKYPRLIVSRRVSKDGNLYFGPYIPASALRKTLRIIYQLFPLRQCRTVSKRERPCLQHQMRRCAGPCAEITDPEEYRAVVQKVKLFLLGKKDHLLASMEKQMLEASERMEYEKAAQIRDHIRAIRQTLQPQDVFSAQLKNKDIIGLARSGDIVCFVVFFVRFGHLMGKKDFLIPVLRTTSDEEALESFIMQFYSQDIGIPKNLLLGLETPEARVIENWLSERRGSAVSLATPRSGEGKRQVDLAAQNARILLESHLTRNLHEDPALRAMREDLGLPRLPSRIEAFDISNLAGSEAVGSMVSWIDDKPAKSEYRRFKIKKVIGIDDYAMIREVVHRRYARLLQEGKGLPDLILIDGGKGHLQAGRTALQELGITTVPVVSLAKREEEIYLTGQESPLRLSRHSESLRLLQRIRDEAHRYAITYHRKLRGENLLRSPMLEIEGIGPARQRAVLRHFGSMARVRDASLDQLAEVPGIDSHMAERIFRFFHPRGENN